MDNCENCGATIGKLETPNVWQDHVVCVQCYAKMAVAAAPVQLIEQTSKKWKKCLAIGAVGVLLGVIFILVGESNATGPGIGVFGVFGWLLFFAGSVLSLVGAVGAWWYHG